MRKLDTAEQRLQEANDLMRADITERKRADEALDYIADKLKRRSRRSGGGFDKCKESIATMHTELEQQVRFETLLADISSRFVNVPANAVDGEIMDAERRISEVLNLDIVSFWQWLDEGSGCFILTHCYNSQEGPRLPDQSNSMDLFPWFQREMRAGRIVSISSLDDLPPEAAPASALSAHELAVESGKKVLHGTDK